MDVDQSPSARRDPYSERQTEAALRYAKDESKDHRRAERAHQWLFITVQTVTIVSAALATIFAVAEDDLSAWQRAMPAAIATLGASVLAAFQFRGAWRRHQTAARALTYEILKFEHELREYRPTPPRPQPDGVDLFLDRVDSISRAGHQDEPTLADPLADTSEEREEEQ